MSTSTIGLDVEVPELGKLFIAGQWVEPETDATLDVFDPAIGEVVASAAAPSIGDADRAVAAARAAFDEGPWPRMSIEERVEVCRRFAEQIEARKEEITRVYSMEAAAPISYAKVMVAVTTGLLDHLLSLALTLDFEERRTTENSDVLVRREPVGTVLAILTYNGPVNLMAMKVFPALLAGCPVIVKPAPESQLTMRFVADAARDAGFPEGVISVLTGDVEVSQHLVGHKGIEMISITGGTKIAIDVVHRSADRLARTALELGGKSPAIIAEDADLEAVSQSLVPGATAHCGQVCVALTRVLAPRSRYGEVVELLAEKYRAIQIGNPSDPSTELGPLTNERALKRTEEYVEAGIAEGAKVAAGGARPDDIDGGWYYQPTLLSDVDNSMRVAQEEIFGPVTCVIPYDDIDDAIRIANDTKYGLAASVYAGSEEAAVDIARQLRSGGVAINTAGVCLTEPFGGMKQSGWGRECGSEGIFEFTEYKQILLSSSLGFDPSAL
ncbi:MAG TPA: aldehyde dehydrogenase family protein [Solirubrobacterales bacterium]|jgi:acyl-CoA reductase-like NAD-dependent aldehyde dehydrogenase|nr:aldehyde dehydrogenase family protein [Solirubrobacterales bacterium]